MSSSKMVDFERVKERGREEGEKNGREEGGIMAQQQQQRQLHGVTIPRHLKRRRVQRNWFRQNVIGTAKVKKEEEETSRRRWDMDEEGDRADGMEKEDVGEGQTRRKGRTVLLSN